MNYQNEDFIYDSETGELFHARDKGKVKAGQLCAPNTSKNGYKTAHTDGKQFYQHRIAWFLVKGYWPGQVDHINGIRFDNRFFNLREVDDVTQHRNEKKPKSNTSGRIGVFFVKKTHKWQAQIRVKRRAIHLGCFDIFDEAVEARKQAEMAFNFHPNHGRER